MRRPVYLPDAGLDYSGGHIWVDGVQTSRWSAASFYEQGRRVHGSLLKADLERIFPHMAKP